MKYIQLDNARNIIAVYDDPQIGEEPEGPGSKVMIRIDYAPERLADDDPRVLAFLRSQSPKAHVRRAADGKIRDLYRQPQEASSEVPATESLAEDDLEVVAFLRVRDTARGRDEIDQARELALAGGVLWQNRRYPLDNIFQLHLTAMISAYNAGVIAPDATQKIRTKNNEIVALTSDELKALAGTVLAEVQAIYQQCWSEKDALK